MATVSEIAPDLFHTGPRAPRSGVVLKEVLGQTS